MVSFNPGAAASSSLIRVFTSNMSKLQSSLAKLASGSRINNASDDAAGIALASSLSASARVTQASIGNASNGISAAQIADGALSSIGDMAGRMRELATQAANGTLSGAQRDSIQQEMNGLQAEINRTIETTEFNGQKLLDGSSLSIQVGSTAVSFSADGQGGSAANAFATLGAVNVSTQAGAQDALGKLEQFSASISTSQGAVGGSINRFESAITALRSEREGLQAAESRIRDTDVAEEVTRFASAKVRQEVNAAMLAQANSLSSLSLKLLS